jgi:hypothetical protein
MSYRGLMTLILGMSKPEGVYLSSDYRVTDARSGKLIDDASVKFLSWASTSRHSPSVFSSRRRRGVAAKLQNPIRMSRF